MSPDAFIERWKATGSKVAKSMQKETNAKAAALIRGASVEQLQVIRDALSTGGASRDALTYTPALCRLGVYANEPGD